MKKVTLSDSHGASKFLAQYIIGRVNAFKPTQERPFVLGLPTGSSPEGVYAELVQAYKEGEVSFKNVVTFNMDEYVGLSPSHPLSYNYYMNNKLFNHTDFQRCNIHLLNGLASDLDAHCKEYDKLISNYAPVHLFLGGLGPDGHLAFNETGSTQNTKTRVVMLAQSTVEANARFFDNDPTKVPTQALTVGISTILDNSDEIALIVLGPKKKKILEKLMHGPPSTPDLPASFLREHPKVLVICDTQALGSVAKI